MKPSLPKGTRDFLPEASVRRQYLFGIIASVFRTYGFAPIETPAMENLSTLTGKYGEEGDRLLFRVLNNGDYLSGADAEALARGDSQALAPSIAKRGMRYDLTVPFARFVVMHQNDLPFPFKRYQIQPVWRADRPQKGRYQEFYQCDVDVVGSQSLLYEAELVQIYDEVFHALKLPVIIRVNHRKILTGIAEFCNIAEHLTSMTTAIDKWDKIGEAGVRLEMEKRGISGPSVDQVIGILTETSLDGLANVLTLKDGVTRH
jgi:histidyl-tRNA synthetase